MTRGSCSTAHSCTRCWIRSNTEASNDDFLAIVFVHGWKHNAHEGDDNIDHFRDALLRLGEADDASRRSTNRRARSSGIYLGWRGESESRCRGLTT